MLKLNRKVNREESGDIWEEGQELLLKNLLKILIRKLHLQIIKCIVFVDMSIVYLF